MRLERADLEGVLAFLADVEDVEGGHIEEAYPVPLLARLTSLIPCDAALHQTMDLVAARYLAMQAYAPDDDEEDDEALYWSLGPCPITEYRARTRDLTTVRMSDVISRQRWLERPIYRDYFRPARFDRLMDLGLSSEPRDFRSLVLFRHAGDPDFSERDRLVFETLRPHFRAREARVELRRRLLDAAVSMTTGSSDAPEPPLTPREREVVRLVGDGLTNAQIAAELWVAPATVKKHLENVYTKLGVGSRAAAASRVHASL